MSHVCFQVDGLCDIVVSASPSCPPLSLFVLEQLLSRQYRVLTVSHVHSSVQQLGDKLRNVFGTTPNRDREAYQFVFTVIWKDGEYQCAKMSTLSLLLWLGNTTFFPGSCFLDKMIRFNKIHGKINLFVACVIARHI